LKKWYKLYSDDKEKIIYIDEEDFEASTERDYGWASRGRKVQGFRSGQKRPRTTMIGALLGKKLLAPFLFHSTTNAKIFNLWLKEPLLPVLEKGSTIVMDNAAFHKSEETKEIVKAAKCKILFLSPYSPDLNPIEQVWANIKRFRKYNNQMDLDTAVKVLGYL
jgi:transposase